MAPAKNRVFTCSNCNLLTQWLTTAHHVLSLLRSPALLCGGVNKSRKRPHVQLLRLCEAVVPQFLLQGEPPLQGTASGDQLLDHTRTVAEQGRTLLPCRLCWQLVPLQHELNSRPTGRDAPKVAYWLHGGRHQVLGPRVLQTRDLLLWYSSWHPPLLQDSAPA